MSTIRFVLRTDKADKYGKCPVELILQIAKVRRRIFTKKKLHPVNWNFIDQSAVFLPIPKARKLTFDPPIVNFDKVLLLESDIKDINNSLAGAANDVYAIEQKFEALKKAYTIDNIVAEYKAGKDSLVKKVDNSQYISHFIERYVDDHSEVRAKGTITIFEALKDNLTDYESTRAKITFDDVNYNFFRSFQNYLIKTGKLQNNTIAKKLSYLKTVIGYARKTGIQVSDSYRDFSVKREKLEVVALTQDEFDKLLTKDFSQNKKLERVRDIFCFSCATGLRQSDLTQLRREHIKQDEINLVIKKTRKELTIPLNKISAAILEKYIDQPKPLPVISNQKLNEYIKEACELAEINELIEIVRFRGVQRETTLLPKYKLIHIHTGRKTYVTLSLERGMSAEQVMSITGHTDYKSFKRYVNITKKVAKVAMAKAWGEVPKLKIVS